MKHLRYNYHWNLNEMNKHLCTASIDRLTELNNHLSHFVSKCFNTYRYILLPYTNGGHHHIQTNIDIRCVILAYRLILS
jgi:hypothetical protein